MGIAENFLEMLDELLKHWKYNLDNAEIRDTVKKEISTCILCVFEEDLTNNNYNNLDELYRLLKKHRDRLRESSK